MNSFPQNRLNQLGFWVVALFVILSLFFVAKTIGEFRDLGDQEIQNTITLQGKGESFAIPDVAEISFGVTFEANDVATAQAEVTSRINKVIAYLDEAGVAKKDIKTVNYNIYPRYEYETKASVCSPGFECRPGTGERVLKGYNVTNDMSVKIRKVEMAGSILSELGKFKVTNLSGISFVLDDENTVIAEAQEKAIDDARSKAKKLAKQLGVRLGDVVAFNEGGNYPIYAKVANQESRDYAVDGAAPAIVEPGENKYVSNVSITYEIK